MAIGAAKPGHMGTGTLGGSCEETPEILGFLLANCLCVFIVQ